MQENSEATHESLVWNVWPDVGKRLDLSKATTWKYVHEGVIPSVRIGKRVLVPKVALEKMLEGDWQLSKESK